MEGDALSAPKVHARTRRHGENSRSDAEARRERRKPGIGSGMAEILWVLSSLKRMNMVKIFTIIEKQVYKKVTHFGGQISKDFEVFLRRYPS
ncbi:MAG: hypothetical protein NTW41_10365, partial [Verrucomicrobia bacterium]|nr:hypothetical protein [Verrucomicrobiota bacterium]